MKELSKAVVYMRDVDAAVHRAHPIWLGRSPQKHRLSGLISSNGQSDSDSHHDDDEGDDSELGCSRFM